MSTSDQNYKWEIDFWENRNGVSPVQKDLEKIRKSDSTFYRHIFKKLEYLQKKPIELLLKSNDLENMKNGLYELKVSVSKKEFRILGVLKNNLLVPVLVSLHSFHKKTNRIQDKEIKVALERKGQLS